MAKLNYTPQSKNPQPKPRFSIFHEFVVLFLVGSALGQECQVLKKENVTIGTVGQVNTRTVGDETNGDVKLRNRTQRVFTIQQGDHCTEWCRSLVFTDRPTCP